MRVFGVDFTSAPRPAKPIVAAELHADGEGWRAVACHRYTDWASFMAWLTAPSSWMAGFDFPLGLPRPFLEAQGWAGGTWADYVQVVAALSSQEWLEMIRVYREGQPQGHKHPLRRTDAHWRAISPLMVYGVPVGRMFYQGGPRLLAAGVAVLPGHPIPDEQRVALETYPAAWVRGMGVKGYKAEATSQQTTAQRAARQAILANLPTWVNLSETVTAACLEDGRGDHLDALICAVQVAQAARQPRYGIPAQADPLEGWIIA